MKAKTPSARRPSKKGKSNRPVTPPAIQQRTPKPSASKLDNAQRKRAKSAIESFVSGVDAERTAQARADSEAAGIDHDRLQEIGRLFQKTPEAQAHRDAVAKANDSLSGPDAEYPSVKLTIEIPKPFADLFTYIERLNARDAGRDPENIATIVQQDVLNEMHQRLHWLCVDPQVFEHYRRMFNRFCVANGWREFQIKERLNEGQGGGSDEPF